MTRRSIYLITKNFALGEDQDPPSAEYFVLKLDECDVGIIANEVTDLVAEASRFSEGFDDAAVKVSVGRGFLLSNIDYAISNSYESLRKSLRDKGLPDRYAVSVFNFLEHSAIDHEIHMEGFHQIVSTPERDRMEITFSERYGPDIACFDALPVSALASFVVANEDNFPLSEIGPKAVFAKSFGSWTVLYGE